jgi:glycosyltransferase involved in cell wall biosynthesis
MCCDLSIVIPAYQAEKYLAHCLDSILGKLSCQAEVIVVDDASTDNTTPLASHYAAEYTRSVKLIRHEHNQGVAASRNTGIAAATGRLLTFLDADDILDAQDLNKLILLQQRSDADLTCSNMRKIKNAGNRHAPYAKKHGIFTVNPQQDFSSLIPHLPLLDSSCAKLFKTKVLHDRNLLFLSTQKYGEDTLFTNAYAIAAHTIVIDYDCFCYHYVQHELSCMHTIDSNSRLLQLNSLLVALANLSPNKTITEQLILRKACETLWAIRKFSRSKPETKARLRDLWSSTAFLSGLFGCIANYGKRKHRFLWKLLTANQNGSDAFWLRFW